MRYSYNGIDGSGRNYQVTIEDKDGDGNFNEIMLTPEGSKTTYFLESSKDDGCFDKTSKIDLKS